MPGMQIAGRAYWIGSDLMMRSRAQAAGLRATTATLDSGEDPSADLVIVDLNTDVAARVDAIARWRHCAPEAVIVGFGSHGDDEVRRQAMAAGATRVVTNSSLVEEVTRLVGTASRG